MPLEKFENFGELTWDEQKTPEQLAQNKRSFRALLIIIFFSLALVYSTIHIVYNNLSHAYDQYSWLNRCGPNCQRYVQLDRLQKTVSCPALTNLYNAEQTNYVLYWRTAIDDRASSLGCVGFPKTQEQIKADTNALLTQRAAKRAAEKEQFTVSLEEDLTFLQPRFMQSMNDGNLTQYIKVANQSPNNKATMNIVVTETFLNQSEIKQRQLASVIWQKWATIYDFKDPNSAIIQLYSSESTIFAKSIPGSPSEIEYIR